MRTIVSVVYGGWQPCMLTGRGLSDPLRSQRREVDVRLDFGQRVAQGVDLLAALRVGKQVGLDGATGFHRGGWLRGSGKKDFSNWREG